MDKTLKDSIIAKADSVLHFSPNPLDSIFYEGYVSNHPRRLKSVMSLRDMSYMFRLVDAYLVTDGKKYAVHAINYLTAWSSTYRPTGNDVNENKLDICFYVFDIMRVLLTSEEQRPIEDWLHLIATKQQSRWSMANGSSNRHVKRLKLILMAAVVLGDASLESFVRSQLTPMITSAFYEDGSSRDLQRRDALHYHVDCIKVYLELAYLARLIDVSIYDLIGETGGSVKKSLHYIFPYVRGEKIHEEWVHTKVGLDRRRWEAGDPYYRPGKPWDQMEAFSTLLLAQPFDTSVAPLIEGLIVENSELILEQRKTLLWVNTISTIRQ